MSTTSRPVPYRSAPARIAWMDYATGTGIGPDGKALVPIIRGRRARPSLADLLDTARAAGASRVYLTGTRPPTGWLDHLRPAVGSPLARQAFGWQDGPRGHYRDADDPRGDYVHHERGAPEPDYRLELRRAAPWFGEVTPDLAARAWALLADSLAKMFGPGPNLLASPTATGQQLWAKSLPKDWPAELLAPDLADLIRNTSPQHRIEATAGCYAGCDAHYVAPVQNHSRLYYYDGRLMYGALLRELGAAPARRLTVAQVAELIEREPYARARYDVSYQVPAGWDYPGLLMTKHDDGQHWHAPSRGGYTGRTWADATEVALAIAQGWPIKVHGGLSFTPHHRPLDTWARRLTKLYANLAPDAALLAEQSIGEVAAAVRHALRAILLTTIGGWHSTGRETSHRAASPREVPGDAIWRGQPAADGTVEFRRHNPLTGAAARHARPELSSQIWARAHARLAFGPDATGFLATSPGDTLGMWGDALYLARPTGWPDDGRIGRLRLQLHLAEPYKAPRTVSELLTLRRKMVPA